MSAVVIQLQILPRLVFCSLALLLSAASLQATPDKWRDAIDALTANDATHPPPAGAVVFIGSSSIRYWATLARDFPGIISINRGFGGSELYDSVFYADRVVLPYHPRLVVLYAGENDLNAGQSPSTVVSHFLAFTQKIHASQPQTKIIFLAIKESPIRSKIRPQVLLTNQLIAAECARDPRCRFVDVATPLLDNQGQTRPELFRPDRLHLLPAGYVLWTKTLAPYLQP
jgi:hypothetical protein